MTDALYKKNMDNEISCLSQILECCIDKGEIADCDTEKVARSILTVTEAIKNRTAHDADCVFTSDVDYAEVVSEVIFAISTYARRAKAH